MLPAMRVGWWLLLSRALAQTAEPPVGAAQIAPITDWTASSSTGLALRQVSVPGDLISDLERNNIIGDPLYEHTFLEGEPLWNEATWTYKATFAGSAAARATLVFEGVKMHAVVSVNGVVVGAAADQFLRYAFDLRNATHDLLRATNVVEVAFAPGEDVGGRFMACSGGWDWAPYSRTFLNGSHTFSKGIWKEVYLATSSGVVVDHVSPSIAYKGAYPTARLADGGHGGFRVDVRVHVSADRRAPAKISLRTAWGAAAAADVVLEAGASTASLSVDADDVRLWWPSGLGAQPLYGLNVTVAAGGADVVVQRRVGFRYFALVTGDDTDPGYVAAAENETGTASHGMYFRVNGVAFFARGANVIPMEELEGRATAAAYRRMVASARDARFNTLRVWGGGIFFPFAFYDACDELGLLVYHDLQYAQEGHAPAATATQEAELRHQVRRLSARRRFPERAAMFPVSPRRERAQPSSLFGLRRERASDRRRRARVHRHLGRLQRVPGVDAHADGDLRDVRAARRRGGGPLAVRLAVVSRARLGVGRPAPRRAAHGRAARHAEPVLAGDRDARPLPARHGLPRGQRRVRLRGLRPEAPRADLDVARGVAASRGRDDFREIWAGNTMRV